MVISFTWHTTETDSDACFVFVSQKVYNQTLVFQIAQSAQKITLLVEGQGLEPRLEFSPSVLELGPLLPYAAGDEAEVVVKNPCSFPIEFYSLEFDQQYLVEEKVSTDQNQTPFSYTCWALPGTLLSAWTTPDLCFFFLWTLPCQFKDHFTVFPDLLPLPWENSLLLCDLIIHFKQLIEKLIPAYS